MATYTVHVPSGAAGAGVRAERTIFVRDGFSWPAFLFGPVFLLYRRLWIAALAWVVVAGGVFYLRHVLHLPAADQGVLLLLLAALTGLEAPTLRQRALDRRGFVWADLLSRGSREEAERGFFQAEASRQPAVRPQAPAAPRDLGGEDVIGLFPRPGDVG